VLDFYWPFLLYFIIPLTPGLYPTAIYIEAGLNDEAVADYIEGLDRRYSAGGNGSPYRGLLEFIKSAQETQCEVDEEKIASAVTGSSTELQHPGHQFYRDLVNILPGVAAPLILRVEKIDCVKSGGIRLNVLTGVLLGLKDAELDRFNKSRLPVEEVRAILRIKVPNSLAYLLHRNNLRSFDLWSLEGSTEPVSATVAWLVRAVGWLCDENNHLAMRMIQNLPEAIASVPVADRGWGTDNEDVREGFNEMSRKQPRLWEIYGPKIEAAADLVGQWRDGG